MSDRKIGGKWGFPENVAQLGTFPEEVVHPKRLEKNPDASPVPELGPSRLLNPVRSSDTLRMGEPQALPQHSESSGALLAHIVIRRLLLRTTRKVIVDLEGAIETVDLRDLPASRREQMRGMVAREHAMLELLARYNALAETVYLRLLSEQKG